MADSVTKQGDTRNALKATLKQDGQAINLTNCSVNFLMQRSGQKVIDKPAIINDAASGEAWVVFTEEDLNYLGLHKAEFVVAYADGKQERFPNDGYLSIKIVKNLEGA